MSWFKFPHIEEPELRIKARRYFLNIFCCFFLLFALIVITVSAVLLSRRLGECSFLHEFYGGVYLLLAAACVTCVLFLLTCVQTQRGMTFRGSLVCVAHVIILIIMFQIFSAIASHILYIQATDRKLVPVMDSLWKSYHAGGRSCVDSLQQEFDCCGVDNDTEWVSEGWVVYGSSPYPSSCLCDGENCVIRNGTFSSRMYLVHVHRTSCYNAVVSYLFNMTLVPRILGPVLSMLESVLLFAAFFIFRHIHSTSVVSAYVVSMPREEAGQVVPASQPEPQVSSVDSQERGGL